MKNLSCPNCSAPATNVGGIFTVCDYCGTRFRIEKNFGNGFIPYDENNYLKIKNRADEAFSRFKFEKAENLFDDLASNLYEQLASTGGKMAGDNVSFIRIINLKAKSIACKINNVIEQFYGDSGQYKDLLQQDLAICTENNISFNGNNLEDFYIDMFEIIEDIIENYKDAEISTFLIELFNNFYGYSKQAIIESSDYVINNYSVIIFQKYDWWDNAYDEKYVNYSLLDHDLDKKCCFYKFTLKILNLYYSQLIKFDEVFCTDFKMEDNPKEWGGAEKVYDFNPILLELYTQSLKECSKILNVNLYLFNNPTFDPKERNLKSFQELIKEYDIFKNNFERFISKKDIELSQISNQENELTIDHSPNGCLVLLGILFFAFLIYIAYFA